MITADVCSDDGMVAADACVDFVRAGVCAVDHVDPTDDTLTCEVLVNGDSLTDACPALAGGNVASCDSNLSLFTAAARTQIFTCNACAVLPAGVDQCDTIFDECVWPQVEATEIATYPYTEIDTSVPNCE